ncbi:enamine deaminase RidA (YjgF/YER057c/UK114 family) [Inquilinus ginsengisoli]|jgi:enamine deaminase RidA (YjgF/YER057c/UK114 family)|uniref:Enamine deaminase RidA (YjgF/YER057c/UK114 family) n=1 Tax=Inquilinus ginsengisoli TaxID=363840 RepID=A0ABU1JQN2_9PROT|nr:Rid family hydrolase [Inquilinus ginsengisoli]MDR6290934.1 enamine deaminase RidA (YjgF/YER057c/UK114 family) [Inquilinus ginsengisoli]
MDIEAEIRSVATRTGMVAIPAELQADVDQFHYAPARRAGDTVHLSGVVACNTQLQPMDKAGFQEELRRVFRQIERLLAACDATLADVVELQMFHVFGSDRLALDKAGQLAAIAAVRDEFFAAPYPAAVELAVAELNPEGGLVEIKATAFAPL